jgi:hypothetical protein
MIGAATEAGLSRRVDLERFSEADPGAGHLIWARFRCTPASPDSPSFYRCAVRFFVPPHVPGGIAELDVLEADLDALPLTAERRITGLFQTDSERLPAVEDLKPNRP